MIFNFSYQYVLDLTSIMNSIKSESISNALEVANALGLYIKPSEHANVENTAIVVK